MRPSRCLRPFTPFPPFPPFPPFASVFPAFSPFRKAFKLSFSYLGECVPTVARSLSRFHPYSRMHIVIRKEKSCLERKAISVSLNFYAHSFTIFCHTNKHVYAAGWSSSRGSHHHLGSKGFSFPIFLGLFGYLVTDPSSLLRLLQVSSEYPRSD